jgi:hypothetical protein
MEQTMTKTVVQQGREWEKRHAQKREALRRGGKPIKFRITNQFHESFGRTAREAFAIFEHQYRSGPAIAQSAMAAFRESYRRSTRRD